jgi:acyl-CoA dehydrogenase
MDFADPDHWDRIRREVESIATQYDQDYWMRVREEGGLPEAVFQDLADAGLIGIVFPEEYGGRGGGMLDLVFLMETLAEEGAWIAANSLVSSAVFGGISLLAHGNEMQIDRYVPKIAAGEEKWSVSVTEKDAGLNTSNVSTTARLDGSSFVIDGGKLWTSGLDTSSHVVVLARTTPKAECDSPLDGLTMFIVDPEMDGVDYTPTKTDVYFPRQTFRVDYNGVRVPEERVLGTVDEGLYQMFDTLNAERLGTAAGAWGAGRHALNEAVDYAAQREVWSEPIGAHQAIQHPLADAHAELETARLALERGAWQWDQGGDSVGEAANVANLQAGKAAWAACEAAMSTHGGIATYTERGIAAAWSFVRTNRIIPVSEEMIRNYLGHRVLGLPQSYR